MKFILSVFPLVFLLASCAEKPPVEEYTLARSAVDAAQNSSATKYAPGLWYKAEENYRQGETLFKKGSFDQAKEYFITAQDYAERAENKARYEKKRLGEDLP
jgi:hypothetical protein